jgi:arsenate reductase-like glutaredoxin family protein
LAHPKVNILADGPQPQIFGRRDSRATQKALRFFSDRRIGVTFVDLARKAIAPGELRRFAERFTANALLDTDSAAYRDAGLAYLSLDDDQAFDRLLANQKLIRLPLIRAGVDLSVGLDEDAWRRWIAS